MSSSSTSQEADHDMLAVRPGKWTLLVVMKLGSGTLRFNELRRDMGGVPQKSLSATLRDLERDGFVRRTAYATIPPRVEYDLTELGRELLRVAEGLQMFALRHRSAVEAARQRFDLESSHGWS